MKNFNSKEMVNEAVLDLKKIAPKDSHVEIDVREDPVGNYQTNIKLTTKVKTYFAKKEDAFVYGSFAKALKAIKTQLRRGKNTRIHFKKGLKDLEMSEL